MCPGYRNQRDLMFRDETQEVVHKAGAKSASAASRRGRPRPSSCSTLPISNKRQVKETLPVILKCPRDLETQAMAFYYQNFLIKGGSQVHGFILPSRTELYHIMLALGYSGLSRSASFADPSQAHGLGEMAYIEAVRGVKSAVFRPTETDIEATLLAVHLLAMYESTATRRRGKADAGLGTMMSAWSNHIHGAAALLEARGITHFETLQQIFVPLCMDCIKRGVPLPENMFKLYNKAKQRAPDRRAPLVRSLDMIVAFCHFYGQVRSHRTTNYRHVIAQAQALDAEAQAVFEHADDNFSYETVPDGTKELSEEEIAIQIPTSHHKYPSFHAAEFWNGHRIVRIAMNQMIRSMLLLGITATPPVFSDGTHYRLLQHATDNLQTLQDGILSSLPQYLGLTHGKQHHGSDGPSFLWQSWPNTREAYQSMSSGWSNRKQAPSPENPTTPQMVSSMAPPLTKPGGGSNLPWALFTLGTTEIATKPLKRWLVARLNYIGEKYSIQQAFFLADKLETDSLNLAWYRDYSKK